MRHLIDGVLVHFAHIEHRIGQRLIVREPVDIRHQPFDRGQLQVFDQILGGLVRSRSQHQRLGTQPARRNAFGRQPQRIQCATPEHRGPGLGGGTRLMQQVRLTDQLALFSSLIGLLLDHLTGRRLRLRGELALQRLQILGHTQHLDGAARMPASTRVLAGRQLLLHRERDPEIRGKTLDQFRPQHFGMNLRTLGGDGRLGEHMCQIGPANGRAILIHRRQIRLLLRARARQIRVMLVDPVTNRTRGIRGRHELDAQLLGQRLDHRQDQLIQQARHIPCELVGRDTRERLQRHMHGDAVGRVGRIVYVAQTQVDGLAVRSGRMPMVGVIVQTHRIAGCQTLHLGRVEIKQIRLTVMLGLPPFRQIGHAGHIVGNDRVVEVEQILVGHGIRQLASAARIIGGILENVAVFAHKVVVTETLLNIALDQTLANQEVARLKRIDASPLHGTVLYDRQTIQQHARGGHSRATRTRPVRLRIRGAGQLAGQRFGPRRVDGRRIAGPQARGLHQFGAHHP